MKKIALHWKIIIGLLLGILWAFLSAHFGWFQFTKDWIAPWGKIFINLLKLIAIPLVLFSIIVGISGLSDVSRLGRVGLKTLTAYLITTVFAVSLGLLLVNFFKPGNRLDKNQQIKNRIRYEIWANQNKVKIKDGKSFLNDKQYVTIADQVSKDYAIVQQNELNNKSLKENQQNVMNTKSLGPLGFLVEMVPSNIFISLSNNKLMLQIIFFAIFFGVVLLLIHKEHAKNVTKLVAGLNEVFLKMVDVVMKAAPFFVFALMASKLSEMAGDNPSAIKDIILNLGWYSLVVIIGLGMMIFIVYPFIVKSFVKKIKYADFFRKISPAQLLAFSSSSSAATLPVTMECVNENLKVPEEISSFVLPVGATVNMDGTSLYQAVAVIYLAQIHLITLDFTQQLTIVATATLASIGSAAVPSAGLVMLMIVLDSVGLNPAWIAIIFPVDRILDMCRTVVNVTGDMTISTVIAKTEGFIK